MGEIGDKASRYQKSAHTLAGNPEIVAWDPVPAFALLAVGEESRGENSQDASQPAHSHHPRGVTELEDFFPEVDGWGEEETSQKTNCQSGPEWDEEAGSSASHKPGHAAPYGHEEIALACYKEGVNGCPQHPPHRCQQDVDNAHGCGDGGVNGIDRVAGQKSSGPDESQDKACARQNREVNRRHGGGWRRFLAQAEGDSAEETGKSSQKVRGGSPKHVNEPVAKPGVFPQIAEPSPSPDPISHNRVEEGSQNQPHNQKEKPINPAPEVGQSNENGQGNEGKPMEEEGEGFGGKDFTPEEEAVEAYSSPSWPPAHIQGRPLPDEATDPSYIPVHKANSSELQGKPARKIPNGSDSQREEEEGKGPFGFFRLPSPNGYKGKAQWEEQTQKAEHNHNLLRKFWLESEP